MLGVSTGYEVKKNGTRHRGDIYIRNGDTVYLSCLFPIFMKFHGNNDGQIE